MTKKARLPRRTEAMVTLVVQDYHNQISLISQTTEVWYNRLGDKVYADVDTMWHNVQKNPKYRSKFDETYLIGALGITKDNSRKPTIVWVTRAKHPKTEVSHPDTYWEASPKTQGRY